jgi:hypothetical protein
VQQFKFTDVRTPTDRVSKYFFSIKTCFNTYRYSVEMKTFIEKLAALSGRAEELAAALDRLEASCESGEQQQQSLLVRVKEFSQEKEGRKEDDEDIKEEEEHEDQSKASFQYTRLCRSVAWLGFLGLKSKRDHIAYRYRY